MGYQPYFIGPIKVGLERDMDSYLIPEDAFPDLENAYLWRGRIYKKGGYSLLGFESGNPHAGRLGIRNDSLAVRGAPPEVYAGNTDYAPIEPGSLIISDGQETFTDNGSGVMVRSPAGGNGTINYTTGAYSVTFTLVNAGAAVNANYFVVVGNSSPVMGLRTFDVEDTIVPVLVAFDLTSAYQFNRTTFVFDQTRFYKRSRNIVAWTGTDTDFFHSTSYQSALFATNNVPGMHTYIITNITKSVTAVITTSTANNLAVGDYVYINNIIDPAMNNQTGKVTVAGNPFTTDIDTSAAAGASSGGLVWELNHTKTAFGDGIRWFDGYTQVGPSPAVPPTGWVNFNPPLDSSQTPRILQGALMLFPYKNYLVALNTVEGTTFANGVRQNQRARWSQYGTVYFTPNPTNGDASLLPLGFDIPAGDNISGQEWYDDVSGRGGFVDAPTAEDIISAEFIKDTLIVYFENSTYKLTYTGNGLEPFIWEKINTSIGSIGTFSSVPFDTSVLSVGNNGIYACDSVGMDRIDRIIPDEAFRFRTSSNAAKRVQGIRDFYSETVLWTYVDNASATIVYPTKTLYYNYLTQSFAIFKNTFTCFGHFTVTSDLTWNGALSSWDFYGRAWNSFISQSGFPIVVAGNQQGFVFQLEQTDGTPYEFNQKSLIVQNISAATPAVFTVPNHNLEIGQYIYLQNSGGVPAGVNNQVYQVSTILSTNTFTVTNNSALPVTILTYTFGGDFTIVDKFNITTKNLNPFVAQGRSVRLGYVDIFFEQGDDIDELTLQMIQEDSIDTVSQEKTVGLFQPSNLNNSKFWRRIHFNTQAEFLRLKFLFSKAQLFDINIARSTVLIHGIILWMKPTGRLLRVFEGL